MSTEKTGIENTAAEPTKDELSEQELDKVSGGSREVANKSETEISSPLQTGLEIPTLQ